MERDFGLEAWLMVRSLASAWAATAPPDGVALLLETIENAGATNAVDTPRREAARELARIIAATPSIHRDREAPPAGG